MLCEGETQAPALVSRESDSADHLALMMKEPSIEGECEKTEREEWASTVSILFVCICHVHGLNTS